MSFHGWTNYEPRCISFINILLYDKSGIRASVCRLRSRLKNQQNLRTIYSFLGGFIQFFCRIHRVLANTYVGLLKKDMLKKQTRTPTFQFNLRFIFSSLIIYFVFFVSSIIS